MAKVIQEEIQESRNARMLTKNLPELAIKLSRIFEYELSNGRPELVDAKAVADVSYIAETHQTLNDVPNVVKLSPKHNIELPPGVTMIIGKSGSGKTKLALERMTALNPNVFYVRYGEPLDRRFVQQLLLDPTVSRVDLLPFEVDVATGIAEFLFSDQAEVLIIDSLRYLFYAGGGSTGKGGVNMTLFADISFLDNVANLRGKSLVVIINPLTDDDASYKAIVEAAKGSVSALIDVQSPTSIRMTSRYEERDFRSISLPEGTNISQAAQTLSARSETAVSLKNYTR